LAAPAVTSLFRGSNATALIGVVGLTAVLGMVAATGIVAAVALSKERQ
jgi:hypothetical protein